MSDTEISTSIKNDKFRNEKIGLCGFKNIGNTCYMNSIIQLLIHSRNIVNFLLCETNPYAINDDKEKMSLVDLIIREKIDGPFVKYFKQCSMDRLGDLVRKKYNLDSDAEININVSNLKMYMENTITIKLAEIVNTLIYCGNSCIVPTGLKKMIDMKIPTMRGFAQQDAHELLIGIYDKLIEETGIDSEPVINNVPDSVKEFVKLLEQTKKKIFSTNSNEEKKKYVAEINKYKEQNKEVIDKYNGLQQMTKVFAIKKKDSFDTSTTGYNPMIFDLLTFNMNTFKCIECYNTIYKYEFNTVISLTVKSTLTECFDDYVKEEQLERKCEVCSCKKSILKKQIWRPAMTLNIQLCRFNNLPNGHSWKNNQDVEIPYILDLSKYCDNSMKMNNSLTFKYKLKGISNHMGSLGGGHYTADGISIVDNETWYHFDDSSVKKYQTNTINTSSAYILLYEMELQ